MKEYTGWLLDLYAQKDGVTLWIVGKDKKPHSFVQDFQITFYVGGPFHRLRQLWKFLREKEEFIRLSRTERRDLHEGMKDVLEVSVLTPSLFDELFKEVYQLFPDLLYYDTDIPLILRYTAKYGVFPLGFCQVQVKQSWRISKIRSFDNPWDLDPKLPDLRILEIRPNIDPSHAIPEYLLIQFDHFKYRLPLENPRRLHWRSKAREVRTSIPRQHARELCRGQQWAGESREYECNLNHRGRARDL